MENWGIENEEEAGKVKILAIGDEFVTHGPVSQLKHDCGIDLDAMRKAVTTNE